MAQKELILKDNYIYRKALMQNHDLEIQDVNGEITMTAGDPEKTDTRQVGAVLHRLFYFCSGSIRNLGTEPSTNASPAIYFFKKFLRDFQLSRGTWANYLPRDLLL